MGSGASKPDAPSSKSDANSGANAAAAAAGDASLKATVAAVSAAATTTEAIEEDAEGVYDGFLVETNIKFDLSVPTSAVEGAIVLVNVVAKLIQAFVNRSKFTRAMENRVKAIEAAVVSLKARISLLEAALPALQNLISILVDFKKFVQYLTKKPDGFFEKAVNFFRAKSDLENLADFDVLFTKALADLNVPLAADQIAMMEQQRHSLEKISGDIAKVLAKLDESKVLAISKRVLTYEESLAFWMDCFPDKFQVPVRDFVVTLKVWFEECRGMQVTKKSVENIVSAINLGELITEDEGEREGEGGTTGRVQEDAPDEFIDAREANLLFAALPDNYQSMSFSAVTKMVVTYVKERRAAELKALQQARESAAKRLAHTDQQMTNAEKQLIEQWGKRFRVRFLCDGFVIRNGKMEKRDDIHCAYMVENGKLHVLGRDVASQLETNWEGQVYNNLTCELQVDNEDAASQESKPKISTLGTFRGNVLCTTTLQRGQLTVYYLKFPLLYQWQGYFEYGNGQRGDMFLFFSDNNGTADGLSDDDVGVAIWTGTITETEFNVTKKYIGRHFVEYKGAVRRKPDGLRAVNGSWQIPGDWGGKFSLWEISKAS